MQRKFLIVLAAVLVGSILLAACQLQIGGAGQPKETATPARTPAASSAFHPETVLGIQGNPHISYPGIPWVRLSYPTCGSGSLRGPVGQILKNTIQSYHNQGIHVMLTYCQTAGGSLFDTNRLNDAALGGADAVQCGNEQMKQSSATTYVTPERFAKLFDLCQSAMHVVRPGIPIILGAMDPLVVADDNAKLTNQVHYLDAMQSAMNTSVHPGGTWNWRSQILGVIDSWHNGYPSAATNNLYQLFVFWSQQLHIDINSGDLGKHLWVIEGTGCVNGCGIDASNPREAAISHILTLITDVQTTMKYHVPFFYFSGTDFYIGQTSWPLGILDVNGHPKPLRQDLQMGARTLEMSCSSAKTRVADREQLLAKLYSGCTLPTNYVSTLES
jgi:predicted small secreted protein